MSEKVIVSESLKHKLSRYLYMQFAEPPGTADSSIDAAWDYLNCRWQPKTVEILKKLAPSMIRWAAELVAFHNHFGIGEKYRHLTFNHYRKDFDLTYSLLLEGVKDFEDRIKLHAQFPEWFSAEAGHDRRTLCHCGAPLRQIVFRMVHRIGIRQMLQYIGTERRSARNSHAGGFYGQHLAE